MAHKSVAEAAVVGRPDDLKATGDTTTLEDLNVLATPRCDEE